MKVGMQDDFCVNEQQYANDPETCALHFLSAANKSTNIVNYHFHRKLAYIRQYDSMSREDNVLQATRFQDNEVILGRTGRSNRLAVA
jgi:hypothetical protein